MNPSNNPYRRAGAERGGAGRLLLVLVASACAAACFAPAACAAERIARVSEVRRSDGGELRIVEGIPFLILAGTPREMGYQYGKLLGPRIREVLETVTGALQHRMQGMPRKQRERLMRSLEAHMPEPYREQIRGMAEGSGLPYADLLAGQYFNDLIRIERCASILAKTGKGLLLGRNVDYYSAVFGGAPVVVDYRPEGGMRSVTVGFIGDCGALSGMNERGITVSIDNAEGAGTVRGVTGMPAHHLLRAVLDSSATLAEADSLIGSASATGGVIIAIGDGAKDTGAVFDLAADAVKRTGIPRSGVLFATNTHIHPDLTPHETLSACPRYALLESRTSEHVPATVDDVFSLLADPGETYGVNNDSTIQTVVLDPSGESIYAAFAPSYAAWGMVLRYDTAAGVATVYRDARTDRIHAAERAEFRVVTLLGAYESGDPRLPKNIRLPGGELVFAIRETWTEGFRERLGRFIGRAGDTFVLKAPEHPDVRVRLTGDLVVSTDGVFRGVRASIVPEDRGSFARKVEYTLHPPEPSGPYRWNIPGAITVERPGIFSGFLRSIPGTVRP